MAFGCYCHGCHSWYLANELELEVRSYVLSTLLDGLWILCWMAFGFYCYGCYSWYLANELEVEVRNYVLITLLDGLLDFIVMVATLGIWLFELDQSKWNRFGFLLQ